MPFARIKSNEGRGPRNYLTLTEISEKTGIPYPRVMRHYRLHKREFPVKVVAGTRVFPGEAVGIFQKLEQGAKRKGYAKIHVAPRASSSDIKAKLGIKKGEAKRARRAMKEVGIELDATEGAR